MEKYKEKYLVFIKIYKDELQNLQDEKAKNLLENSLYLSMFTVFESFIKELIESYNENIIRNKVTFQELNHKIAREIFKDNKKRIIKIFEKDDESAFKSYFDKMKNPIDKSTIDSKITFHFFHKKNLDNYYPILFSQIFNDENLLKSISIKLDTLSFNELTEDINQNALTFILNYCEEVRNKVAHENDNFNVQRNYTFESTAMAFIAIINEMIKKYESVNKWKFDEIKSVENILEEYNDL